MPQSGFTRVLTDVSELCELQWQLFVVDSSEAARSMIPAIVSAVAAGLFSVAAVITLSLAAAWSLASYAQWSLGSSLLLVGSVDLILAMVAAYVATRCLQHSAGHYQDSRSELQENLKWLRATLLDPDSPRNQMSLNRSVAAPQSGARF